MVAHPHRINEYTAKWKELTDVFGSLCYYCKKEIATTLDHVVPYSYDQDSSIVNLVPACATCNLLASNHLFNDVEEKRRFILHKRKSRANAIVTCSECLLPYIYREQSPSLFLCAECYDAEYNTKLAAASTWRNWLDLLYHAGIPAPAHRVVRRRMHRLHNVTRTERLQTLVDEYGVYLSSDPGFAELLIRT